MPTALITGIAGQDGSLLAQHLLARGDRVVGVVRPGFALATAPVEETLARCELHELDLAAVPLDWAERLVGEVAPDQCYHLAACHRSSEPGAPGGPGEQQRMVAVNYAAGLALAHAILARGSGSLVLAGSSQMYSPAVPALRVDERTPFAPSTFYGVTKVAACEAIRWLREHQGLRGGCAILFNHESERRSTAFVSRRISRAAARIAAGLDEGLELLDLYGAADFSSAFDVVDALHRIASAPTPGDYVIASGELHTVEDLCAAAFSAVGLDHEKHVRSLRPAGPRAGLVGEPRRIEAELGWTQRRTLAGWMTDMVRADQHLVDRER
jgi:GDPmannose 4,6-dehydratase